MKEQRHIAFGQPLQPLIRREGTAAITTGTEAYQTDIHARSSPAPPRAPPTKRTRHTRNTTHENRFTLAKPQHNHQHQHGHRDKTPRTKKGGRKPGQSPNRAQYQPYNPHDAPPDPSEQSRLRGQFGGVHGRLSPVRRSGTAPGTSTGPTSFLRTALLAHRHAIDSSCCRPQNTNRTRSRIVRTPSAPPPNQRKHRHPVTVPVRQTRPAGSPAAHQCRNRHRPQGPVHHTERSESRHRRPVPQRGEARSSRPVPFPDDRAHRAGRTAARE